MYLSIGESLPEKNRILCRYFDKKYFCVENEILFMKNIGKKTFIYQNICFINSNVYLFHLDVLLIEFVEIRKILMCEIKI